MGVGVSGQWIVGFTNWKAYSWEHHRSHYQRHGRSNHNLCIPELVRLASYMASLPYLNGKLAVMLEMILFDLKGSVLTRDRSYFSRIWHGLAMKSRRMGQMSG